MLCNDWKVSLQRFTPSKLVLCGDSKLVLMALSQAHHLVVGAPHKLADWFPGTCAGVHLLHNIVGDWASTILLSQTSQILNMLV